MEHGAIPNPLKLAFVSYVQNKTNKFTNQIVILDLLIYIYCVVVLPCPANPPPAPPGEGAERIFGTDITNYRCQNGYMWENGRLFPSKYFTFF
jgi:hypothetical protein